MLSSTVTAWLSSLQRLEKPDLLPGVPRGKQPPWLTGQTTVSSGSLWQSYLWIKMQLPRLPAQDLQRGLKIQERGKAELSFDVCKCKLQTGLSTL